jgi:hypothetical protein
MKLEYQNCARRDFRSYAILVFGLIFVFAGVTVDPSTNCDESGRECAPWLVPMALGMGILASLAAMASLVRGGKWGSRIDLQQQRLYWWDTRESPTVHSIAFADIKRITVRVIDDSDDNLFFYDRDDVLLPIPKTENFPHTYEKWAQSVAIHFPHVVVEVENGGINRN